MKSVAPEPDMYSNVESHGRVVSNNAPAKNGRNLSTTASAVVNSMFMNAHKPTPFMDKFIDSSLPETELIDKHDLVKNGIAIPLTFVYYAVLVGLFVGFFIYGYNRDTSTVYLTPYESPQPSNCKQVPISTTHTFKVDDRGNWEGNPGYSDANAVYAMEFIRANLNEEMYEEMMVGFKEDVMKVSDAAFERDLQFNQIIISSFNSRWTPTSAQKKNGAQGVVNFYAIGDAPYVFQSDIEGFSFFSKANASVCVPSSASASYDLAGGNFVLSFDIVAKNDSSSSYDDDDSGYGEEPCPGVFGLSDFSSLDFVAPLQVDVNLNVPALTTALAINYRVAKSTSLTQLFNLNSRQRLWADNFDDTLVDYRRLSSSDIKEGRKQDLLTEINKVKRDWKYGAGTGAGHGSAGARGIVSPIDEVKRLRRESQAKINKQLQKANISSFAAVSSPVRELTQVTYLVSYSASDTDSAQQNTIDETFYACGNVRISTCTEYGGAYTSDTYLRLFDSSGVEVAYSDDDSDYGYCSTIRHWFEDCDTITIAMGCFDSGSCTGSTSILYYDQDTSSYDSPYYDDASSSGFYADDDGGGTDDTATYYADDNNYADDDYFTDDYTEQFFTKYSEAGYYVDDYYDSMEPIFCVTAKSSDRSSCFVQTGGLILLPFVLNRGFYNQSKSDNEFITTKSRCEDSTCSNLFNSGLNTTFEDFINIRLLRNSLLFLAIPFDPVILDEDILDALVAISNWKYKDQLDAAFDVAMFASFQEIVYEYSGNFDFLLDYTGPSGTGTTIRQYLNESMIDLFTSIGADALLTTEDLFFININEVETADLLNLYQGTRINAAGQLFYHNFTGSTKPFYLEYVFNQIATNPPVTLVQGYMECTTPAGVAAANNLGIAFSNTTSFGALFFSLLIVLSIYVMNEKAKETKRAFIIPKTKKHTLNVLALTALMEELVAVTACDKEKCNEILRVLASTNSIENAELKDILADSEKLSGEVNRGRASSLDLLQTQIKKFNI